MKPTRGHRVAIIADKKSLERYRKFKIEGASIGLYRFAGEADLLPASDADVLLIDCGRHVQTGLDLLQKFKSRRKDLPVFFLTDRSSDEAELKAFRKGAREYFTKPMKLSNLRAKIETMLVLKSGGREVRPAHPRSGGQRREAIFQPVTAEGPREIQRALQYIQDKSAEAITLARLGEEAGFSKYHFARQFKRHVGMSPMKYVINVRVQKAAELLRTQDLTVSEVARQVGFHDLSNFTRHFKRFAQYTPSAFKKLHAKD